MKASLLAIIMAVLLASVGQAEPIRKSEVDYQSQSFLQWWDTELEWRFAELPEKGSVPTFRVPYSGHDYPDRGGGTINALRRYDYAFHGGRSVAAAWEREDTGQTGRGGRPEWVRGRGFFRNLFAGAGGRRSNVPNWYGHCNGWTAAAIRHAAPERSVTRNGVVFSPADIKGLLAEIYMYSDSDFLGGEDFAINPALMHVVLANWLGRGSHPVGIETTLGEEKWNYPAYAFAMSSADRGEGTIEVKMNLAYSMSTRQEFDFAQHIKHVKYFHYDLNLDEDGRIIGGEYYRDSSQMDMLWVPMRPVQAGEEGNKRGNPHVDVDEVLAIWRDSVSEDLRAKWFNIDPTDEDRIDIPGPEASTSEVTDDDETPAASTAATEESDAGVTGNEVSPATSDE